MSNKETQFRPFSIHTEKVIPEVRKKVNERM